jgi:hypothetical protein
MAVFISHSEKDKATFSGFRAGLIGQGIEVWNPESMGAGASLSDQLRDAINTSDVCIFFATKNSIQYEWCMAEVGAFWGAGKGVIIYKADPDVEEKLFPPQLKGHIWRDNFDYVVSDVKKFIFEANERRKREAARRPRMVSEMTIAALYDVLTSLRSTAQDALPIGEAMRLIHENIFHNLADAQIMQPLIARLVGVPQGIIEEIAGKYWPTPFRLATDTGEWLGFARKFTSYELASEYSNCLLILCNDTGCVAAITASTVVEREDKIVLDGLIENTGTKFLLGTPKDLSAKGDA